MNPFTPEPVAIGRPHGRPSTYTNHGCRCAACRDAWARYAKTRRAQKKEKAA